MRAETVDKNSGDESRNLIVSIFIHYYSYYLFALKLGVSKREFLLGQEILQTVFAACYF